MTNTMQRSPLPTPPTYTSIPISAGDVVSRSIQNLSIAVSRHRPWPEFASLGVFDRPDNLPSAVARVQKNARFFLVNYSILLAACEALSLIGSPGSLLIVSAVVVLWLLLYFFREDPLILFGRHLNDYLVLLALFLSSLLALWFTACFWTLALGLAIGLLVCAVHAVFRNSDGLFLDEEEAASRGLVADRG
ncbi:PRA1 family protein G2 [Carica papaya]|uniref:PRA1 family protein G2 n=1 Tax=Carica papaya TaxID=3649 RepID=UPI000B8D18F9|nr:PRA1 family protein G2 [Carica papaya]